MLVFGHHSECERLQKRWVSLRLSYFVRNWSARAVRFNGRVLVYPLYPTYKSSLGFGVDFDVNRPESSAGFDVRPSGCQ